MLFDCLRSLGDSPRLVFVTGLSVAAVLFQFVLAASALRRAAAAKRPEPITSVARVPGIPATLRGLELAVLSAIVPALGPLFELQQLRAQAIFAKRASVASSSADQQLGDAVRSLLAFEPIAIVAITTSVLLACATVLVSARARGRAAPSTHLGVALAVATLGPVLVCSLLASVRRLESFQRVVLASAPEKRSVLEQGLRDAGEIASLGWTVACAMGIVVCAGAAFARRSPLFKRVSVLHCAASVSAALVLAGSSAPLREENRQPWPSDRAAPLGTRVAPLALIGPDPLTAHPVLELGSDELYVDKRRFPPHELETELRQLARHFALLHPKEPFAGALVVVCARRTAAHALIAALGRAAAAGYRDVTFALDKPGVMRRPVLGEFTTHHLSGARVALVTQEGAAGLLTIGAAATCEEVVAAVIEQRKSGELPALRVGGT